ncbi:MAG: protein kinase [Blastocatellia bacterium]|nr:protein kinase [Blastocatellia bacterium]
MAQNDRPLFQSKPEISDVPTEFPTSLPSAKGNEEKLVGKTVQGRYMIESELGRGGIGVVYLAHDTQVHNRPVVIKVLLSNPSENDWVARKFHHESEALSRIDHPGVVKVLDRGQLENGKPFLVMEFVKGTTLRTCIPPTGMEFPEVARIVRQLGDILTAVHKEGIFHRDLKPENIMLQTLSGGHEQAKLIDFGIAKIEEPRSAEKSSAVLLAGTLSYMAPEQIERGQTSAASDIFALGVIVYEMITGRRPFDSNSEYQVSAAIEILKKHQTGITVPPRSVRPEIPDVAQTYLAQALHYDPQKRPKTAEEFADNFARYILQPVMLRQPEPMPDNIQTMETMVSGQVVVTSPEEIRLTDSPRPATNEEEASPPTKVGPKQRPVQEKAPPTVVDSAKSEMPATVLPRPSKSLGPMLGIGAAAVVVILGVVGFLFWPKGTPPEPPSKPPVVTPVATHRLSYWMTVQKDPAKYPDSKPFRLPGEVIFSPGDRVWLSLENGEDGYLYIINEGPQGSTGLPDYLVLFPKSSVNGGSALVGGKQEIRIPGQNPFVFDQEEGVEKLWFIWSKQSIPQLEAIKTVANPEEKGVVSKPDQIQTLRDLLVKYGASKPTVEKNDDQKLTLITSQTDPFVNLVKLEHH